MFFKDICQKQQNERAASTINVTHTLMNVVLKYGNGSFQGPLRMVPYFTIYKASKKGFAKLLDFIAFSGLYEPCNNNDNTGFSCSTPSQKRHSTLQIYN